VIDESGKLKGLNTVRVDWTKDSGGRWKMEEVPGSEQFYDAQLVFLALGFLGPESELVKSLGLKVDGRSNIQTPHKVCSISSDSDFVGSSCAEILDQH
jgi:glutamate synthase (NADH)